MAAGMIACANVTAVHPELLPDAWHHRRPDEDRAMVQVRLVAIERVELPADGEDRRQDKKRPRDDAPRSLPSRGHADEARPQDAGQRERLDVRADVLASQMRSHVPRRSASDVTIATAGESRSARAIHLRARVRERLTAKGAVTRAAIPAREGKEERGAATASRRDRGDIASTGAYERRGGPSCNSLSTVRHEIERHVVTEIAGFSFVLASIRIHAYIHLVLDDDGTRNAAVGALPAPLGARAPAPSGSRGRGRAGYRRARRAARGEPAERVASRGAAEAGRPSRGPQAGAARLREAERRGDRATRSWRTPWRADGPSARRMGAWRGSPTSFARATPWRGSSSRASSRRRRRRSGRCRRSSGRTSARSRRSSGGRSWRSTQGRATGGYSRCSRRSTSASSRSIAPRRSSRSRARGRRRAGGRTWSSSTGELDGSAVKSALGGAKRRRRLRRALAPPRAAAARVPPAARRSLPSRRSARGPRLRPPRRRVDARASGPVARLRGRASSARSRTKRASTKCGSRPSPARYAAEGRTRISPGKRWSRGRATPQSRTR